MAFFGRSLIGEAPQKSLPKSAHLKLRYNCYRYTPLSCSQRGFLVRISDNKCQIIDFILFNYVWSYFIGANKCFLDASTHPYESVHLSVRPSVRPSVHLSVRSYDRLLVRLLGHPLFCLESFWSSLRQRFWISIRGSVCPLVSLSIHNAF